MAEIAHVDFQNNVTVLRFSEDSGVTWQQMQDRDDLDQPGIGQAMIQDKTGRVWSFYYVGKNAAGTDVNRIYYKYSDDQGHTWSEATVLVDEEVLQQGIRAFVDEAGRIWVMSFPIDATFVNGNRYTVSTTDPNTAENPAKLNDIWIDV